MEKILTVEDIAQALHVKPLTVREMFREYRLRGFKVGKVWRTTETMFQEDLATIARGEKPEPLEAQVLLKAMPKKPRGRRKATPAAAAPAAAATPAPPATPAPEPATEDAPDEAPVKKAKKSRAPKAEPVDDQTLLF